MTMYEDFTSSNVARLGYEPETKTVRVEFKNKAGAVTSIWNYTKVEEEDFELIHTAPSVGHAVRTFLVGGPYTGRRVE